MVSGNLVIKPINATLTRDTELLGKMDPYCVFILGDKKFKTKVKDEAGKNPNWVILKMIKAGEEFVTRVENLDMIEVEVWDEDVGKDDFVGSG